MKRHERNRLRETKQHSRSLIPLQSFDNPSSCVTRRILLDGTATAEVDSMTATGDAERVDVADQVLAPEIEP